MTEDRGQPLFQVTPQLFQGECTFLSFPGILFREYVETVLMEKNFDSPALKGIMLFHFKTITFIFQVELACYVFIQFRSLCF